ncbi:MAG TPA: 2-hydroxychromene-2-carboxylate isomerase [Burkholderiaceae bacterium]|nr:2-hydroxychromene-2-carboxylate isomerase [Burkholderiaceae bacterium]
MSLDVYCSVESIWTYIGFQAFRSLLERHAVRPRFRPVPLLPLFAATGGTPLRERPPGRRRYRDFEVQRWCARRGVSLGLTSAHLPPRASLPDRMVIVCERQGCDPVNFIDRALTAAWRDGADVGNEEVCEALAEAAGLPARQLLTAAADPSIAECYQANLQAAIEAGVFGAPTFVRDGEVFWGQDRIEMLDEALTTGRAPYRPLHR